MAIPSTLYALSKQPGDSDLWTLALLGKGGGAVAPLVHLALIVPSSNTQRIQEVHMTVGHILCGALERRAIVSPLPVSYAAPGVS